VFSRSLHDKKLSVFVRFSCAASDVDLAKRSLHFTSNKDTIKRRQIPALSQTD
jgi:hypothetical protein